MIEQNHKQLGNTLWSIADQLRGAMDADDFRDYMLSFLFLRYLSDNYDGAARKERIRTKLLKDGHIDTVIGLPANLFFSTGIPVCVLVLKKCKKPDDVLFINAADHFEKGKRQNVLMPEHIDKIIDTYCILQEANPQICKVFSPGGGWGIFTLPGASGTPSPGCLGHQRAAGIRDE